MSGSDTVCRLDDLDRPGIRLKRWTDEGGHPTDASTGITSGDCYVGDGRQNSRLASGGHSLYSRPCSFSFSSVSHG